MGKAASGGQFRNLISGLNTTTDSAIETIDGAKIQNAINELGKGITQQEFIKWINNGCRLEYILATPFTIGDIFRHRAEKGDRRLFLSGNTQSWYIKPYAERVVVVKNDLPKISEYRLPANMNDTAIQEILGNPGFMDFDTYIYVMYLFIFQPELAKQVLGYELRKDKWYTLYVELPEGEKITVRVFWLNDEWGLHANCGDDETWGEGDLVLYFAAATK